jgi:CheY-like chemotaxis protein
VRLQQILENLILNAVKYTEPGGSIEVSAETELGGAVIRVRDSGIGIARDKLPHVWDLFVQVDESPERTRKGLGIGLALVRDLVKRHGGTVEAHSDGLGLGSTFTVRLPRAVRGDMTVSEKPEPKPQAASAPGKRILIVDDNVDAAETLAMMLELLGQETHQEHDGKAALKAAAEYRPRCVSSTSACRGSAATRWRAASGATSGMEQVYLIALSGYGTEEDRRKSFYAASTATS